MGPTNIALVQLFRADAELREAQLRLDNASVSVRQHERRIADFSERLRLAQTNLRQSQSQAAQLELDVRVRDEHIEKLRRQQQTARNHKEYQAFLTEINAEKIDKGKVEDELLKVLQQIEEYTGQVKELGAQLESETQKCQATREQLSARLSELGAEIERLRPIREQAAAAVPQAAREMFDKLAERYDGEAMSALGRPDRRREEYVCTACNMDLFPDVYNRLHSRDEMVVCPNCRRLLFIPDDLPPQMAINKVKERKEPRAKEVGAAVPRATLATDVLNASIPEEAPAAPQGESGSQTA